MALAKPQATPTSTRQVQHRSRSDHSRHQLLSEVLDQLRAIRAAIPPPNLSIRTEVPLTRKEAAAELGLKLVEFNRMIEKNQLRDGLHYLAMGESFILSKDVLDLLRKDRREFNKHAPVHIEIDDKSGRSCANLNY